MGVGADTPLLIPEFPVLDEETDDNANSNSDSVNLAQTGDEFESLVVPVFPSFGEQVQRTGTIKLADLQARLDFEDNLVWSAPSAGALKEDSKNLCDEDSGCCAL